MLEDSFVVEGEVTKVCEDILCFVVKNVKVHAIFNCKFKLPEQGTIVKVASPFYNTDGFKVTSMVLSPEEGQIEGTSYVNFIGGLNVTPSEYLQVAKVYDDLVKYFVPPAGITHEQILQNIVTNLGGVLNFQLKFVSQIKYIDNNQENFKYSEYFTFGNHWNYITDLKKNYLFGYLKMDRSGVLVLTDFKGEIPCIITSECYHLECYVLVEDFVVTTEVYNCTSFAALEYLIVDASKIIKCDITMKEETLPTESFFLANKYWKCLCHIVRKSVYMAVSPNKSVFWLEIIQNEKANYFLSFDESYLNIYRSLKIGLTYYLYYKNRPRRVNDKEISVMDSAVTQFELGPGSYFIPVSSSAEPPPVIHVSEAPKHLKSPNLVSFEGSIYLKKFVDKLPSHTHKATNDPKYGTPGDKTHLLEFRVNSQIISVYLNNWENMCLPYGLIPDMKVVVRNVKPQSGRYFKSVVMTSFEIVRYEPKARFESANLCRPDWGLRYYLGAQGVIPKDTVIWGRPISFCVQELRIDIKDQLIDPVITLVVFDLMGEAKIIAKNEEGVLLLRHLLGPQEPLFKKWCDNFHLLAPFTYNKGMEISQYTDQGLKGTIQRMLVQHFSKIGEMDFEFLCRVVDQESSGKPIHMLLNCRQA